MKKAVFLFCFYWGILAPGFAQSFYEIDSLQLIEITFPFGNWDYQLDTAMAGSESYIIASSISINGEVLDSVGVKYKGNSSYQPNNAKNPLHIELNFVKDNQNYQGYTDIKLGNGFADPSMIREVLGYDILRNYMHAPLSNFARVYINGVYKGLYSNSEHVGKDFAGDHFFSTSNALFKCNPVYGGGGGAADLRYLGSGASLYYNSYELKSDDLLHWEELVDLCDTLNNFTPALPEILDVDRALWMLAFNNVTVNLDSYTGGIRQNYYLYRDDNGRFNPVVWDLNQCFGSFRALSGGPGGPGNLDTTGMKNMAINANASSPVHPLIQKTWNNPMFRRMYVAHVKTMVEEMFASNWYYGRAQELQDFIEEAVLEDVNKFFSNSSFYNSLTSNISGGGPMGYIPGIRNLMLGRVAYLSNTPEFNFTAPEISDIILSGPPPAVFQNIFVTATVQNADNVWLGHRYATPAAFMRIPMFDDGQHNDGAAGDHVYGVLISLLSARTEFYIYAENANAGMFSPQRAEHEYYVIHAGVPAIAPGQLVINELVADNESGARDADGQYDDWIELYNNTTFPISLADLYLSDNADNTEKWAFPEYAVIPADGYLPVWCDEDNGQSGFHASFKLSKNGETIRLGYAGGQAVDSVAFTGQESNESLARCENGTGPFTYHIQPTFAAFNDCEIFSPTTETAAGPLIELFPNPAGASVQVLSEIPLESVEIINFAGQLKYQRNGHQAHALTLDTGGLPPGIYIVRINGARVRKLIITK